MLLVFLLWFCFSLLSHLHDQRDFSVKTVWIQSRNKSICLCTNRNKQPNNQHLKIEKQRNSSMSRRLYLLFLLLLKSRYQMFHLRAIYLYFYVRLSGTMRVGFSSYVRVGYLLRTCFVGTRFHIRFVLLQSISLSRLSI